MDINNFMFTLINELNENLFYEVELCKDFNKYDKTYLLRVMAKRENKKYDYGFSINEKWLDSISINEIINFLLMQ